MKKSHKITLNGLMISTFALGMMYTANYKPAIIHADTVQTTKQSDTQSLESQNDKILNDSKNVVFNQQLGTQEQLKQRDYVPNRSLGVDVSSYQGTDMSVFAKQGAKFVSVKVSEGTNYINPNAKAQIASSYQNKMMVQAYHYAHIGGSVSKAKTEADYAIRNAKNLGLKQGAYFACDYESDATGNINSNTQAVKAFMQKVKDAGYIPLLYSGASYMKAHLNLTDIVNTYGSCIWIAAYDGSNTPNFNHFPSTDGVIIWQFGDNAWKGQVADGNINVLPLEDKVNSDGQRVVNGHWQYWKNGKAVKNQYVYIADQHKVCYYDGNGNMVYGQKQIGGYWQYFDPNTGAQAKNQYVYIKDQNKTCYYDGNGNMVYGERNINGHWQYFEPYTGAQAKNKWVDLKNPNKTVFYDSNGNMMYGAVKMGNNWKYFDPVTGAQAKDKYITDNGKTYYYNGNGDRLYGQHCINGKWQYFDQSTGVQAKNQYVYIKDQNKTCYYDGNGNMVYGERNINGHWQYFDPNTGAQAKNKWIDLKNPDKTVFYDGNGNMVYGQIKMGNNWKYFDPVTGAQAKNKFVYIKDQNKTCYYNNNGDMVYGWQTINGHKCYFDSVTGKQAKDCTLTIDGKKYSFDKNGYLINK